MLLHAIGRSGKPPSATNPWIAKYIFPGGYIPSAVGGDARRSSARASIVTDIEILRLHYAETLKIWRERFMANREEAKALYDERFCRMWEFYLAGSEASFRVDGKYGVSDPARQERQNAVPPTRDYIAEREARLREREEQRPALRLAGE